jgi:hypothetical protein
MKHFLLFLAILCTFACATPIWVAVDESATEPKDMEMNVISESIYKIQLEVKVYGYFYDTMTIHGKTYAVISIPGCALIMQPGMPQLPKFASLVNIPDNCKVSLDVTEKNMTYKDMEYPIMPSKGHLKRSIDPKDIAYTFHKDFLNGHFFPAEKDMFSVGESFYLTDARGVRISVFPISVNNKALKMNVLKSAKLTLTLKYKNMSASSVTLKNKFHKTPKAFQKLYKHSFINFKHQSMHSLRSLSTDNATDATNESNKKLVVIVPTEFKDAITDWVTWKKKCGYTVTVKTITTNDTATTIKSYLQSLYDNTSTRFGYVVLMGDASSNSKTAKPMPTFQGDNEGAASDRVYVRLAGNDYYPDAFISRVSATTADGIKKQLAKIIAYEKATNSSWTKQGVCIASGEGSNPIDWERAELLQNGGKATDQKVKVLSGGLLGAGYKNFTDIYDKGYTYAKAQQVTDAVNAGCGIICYIGHGSTTSWGTTGFSTGKVAALNNGEKLPVIWSVACLNGSFANTKECFAEAWLRKTNGGAAGMEASSTEEEWVPPCDKQAATVNAIITGKYYTFGALEQEGVIAGLKNWGDTKTSSGNMMAEQVNLFGDCTMIVKTGKSRSFEVITPKQRRNTCRFILQAQDRESIEATVTVYNQDMSFIASSETNDFGMTEINLENAPKNEQLYYTIVGNGIDAKVDVPLE